MVNGKEYLFNTITKPYDMPVRIFNEHFTHIPGLSSEGNKF